MELNALIESIRNEVEPLLSQGVEPKKAYAIALGCVVRHMIEDDPPEAVYAKRAEDIRVDPARWDLMRTCVARVLETNHPEWDEINIRCFSGAITTFELAALTAPSSDDPIYDQQIRLPQYVYFMQFDSGEPIKIGITSDVASRKSNLEGFRVLHVLAVIEGDGALERYFHNRFAEHRVKGEWFSPTDELLELIATLQEVK
jgi:hypothetical protein